VRPAAHPETECPFYRGGWQTFLLAGQPDANGEPAIRSYPVLDDVFQRYTPLAADQRAPEGTPRGTSTRAWLGDIKQAGGRQILVDQNGHTLYYGIHVNQAFAEFIHAKHLETAKAIQNADPYQFFPSGLAEFKTAWQEVDGITDPNDPELADYVHTEAWVPTLSQNQLTKAIEEDRDHPRSITVRLLAIHAVFTIPGHPEFVWASMEHSSVRPSGTETDTKAADGHRNVAPVVPPNPDTGELVNPTVDDPNNVRNPAVVADTGNFLLYKLGTAAKSGNIAYTEEELVLDPGTQTFKLLADNTLAQTPIYRMFPASKSNTTDPDDAITTLNHNVEQVFLQKAAQLDANDKRGHYRLVGAQWMDKPAYFDLNLPIQNNETSPLIQDPGAATTINQAGERAQLLAAGGAPRTIALASLREKGSDSPFSILAGEDRMSSTAMESFTQTPTSFFNCFSCHNTQAVTTKGVPLDPEDSAQVQLLTPKLMNVSHVLSQFVLEECGEDPNNLQNNPDSRGGKMVVCP
jgi:hypothetical protein